ncbi:MAG: glucose-6-phosphate isomerase [Alphaproteobacteria bacterium]|nr:glucose-6-phosphate isomerase [Alphaproteobacteria bacterium]
MKSKSDIFTQNLEGLPPISEAPQTLLYLQGLEESLPLFQQIKSDDLLTSLAPIASHFQAFEDILILGTGGSSLGGQTLIALRNPQAKTPRFHFLDNIDPYTFHTLLSKLDITKTGAIAISKSGNTAETITQLLLCIQHWLKSIPEARLTDHFQIITEPVDNGIRRLANAYALPCLDHPTDIGGRFAVFTVVGILPALIAGLDAKALLTGARDVLRAALDVTTINECLPLQGAGLHMTLAKSGITQTVLMPYVDRLNTFTFWFRQLWAESLGKLDTNKERQGITPIQSLGTVDQHSQLQLYLDGPRDKFFTLITLDQHYDSTKINLPPVGHATIDLFQNKTMGDLMLAEQQATIDTLRNNKCPTRVIHLNTLDEKTLGGLMMHYMLETLATAHLMNVNPFDQPAVEEGKILTKAYLENAA